MSHDLMTGTVELSVAGEPLRLLPDRAVFWPSRSTLLVADPHFGKAAAFRRAGLAIPLGTTGAAVARLDAMVTGTGATRLIFLGDLLHAREGRSPSMLAEFAQWRQRHAAMPVVLVRGNHDRRAGDPPAALGIECLDSPLIEGPFALAHYPEPVPARYTLAGHLHPCVKLRGPARQRARLPCFWFGASVGVLPAFGEFTGCAEVTPQPGDRIWVVADQQVVTVE